VGARLADDKVPVAVRAVGQLPRSPGGKLLKQALRQAWQAEEERQP
jgi:acyl-CoA synthetase (AMP-forming)/AMP-acid ligase II